MTVVSDFTVVQNEVKVIATSNDGNQDLFFNTGGRRSQSSAYIIFMVRGLTLSSSNPIVSLNGDNIGSVQDNKGGSSKDWETQIITFDGSVLNDGNNRLRFGSANDQYRVHNVICNFKQSV